MKTAGVHRRQFLLRAGQAGALAAVGGSLWAYLLDQQARAAPQALRPPGARSHEDFQALCIKCGQCAAACPYDTLRLAAAGDDVALGTPFFTARDIPCYMCPDIPCQAACPTGALDPEMARIEDARMGLAVIDAEHCLSWQGLRCEICYRECPVSGQAIGVEHHPRKLSKHALFVPVVHSDHCTGCGVCEKVCPTEQAAVRILPRGLVAGRLGEHYRLGWKDKGAITQDFRPQTPGDKVGIGGLDYLNEDPL